MTDQGCDKTILIVEDDADLRNALAEVLEDGDYKPLRAENGVAALEELRTAQQPPCVILLDVMMPIMDGRTFRAVQQRDPALSGIPVIVLSAHADAQAAAAQMDAQGYLTKPVDLGTLMDVVERFCARPPAPAGQRPASPDRS